MIELSQAAVLEAVVAKIMADTALVTQVACAIRELVQAQATISLRAAAEMHGLCVKTLVASAKEAGVEILTFGPRVKRIRISDLAKLGSSSPP